VPIGYLGERQMTRPRNVSSGEFVILPDVDQHASGVEQNLEGVDVDLGNLAHS